MRKWFMTTLTAVALACPTALLQAQQPDQPDPAPQPAPQPANNERDEPDQQAMEQARQAQEEARREVEGARRQMEVRLRALTEQQRAAAAQAADAFRGVRVARGKTEKASWLGVSTSKVPQALRQHLDLKHKYIGLVVERVEPNSPADAAGLEQFDIIERVNDQWIVNTEQFSVVLRMHDPGAEVNLAIIRKGKPQDVKVTLAEKELPVLGFNEFNIMDLPAGGGFGGGGPNFFEVAPQGRLIIRDPAGFEPLMQFKRLHEAENAQITVKDPEHSLKVTTNKGKRYLEASDANGVVFFEGPINTDEERARIPEEIRQKVETMQDLHRDQGTVTLQKPPTTAPARERE